MNAVDTKEQLTLDNTDIPIVVDDALESSVKYIEQQNNTKKVSVSP